MFRNITEIKKANKEAGHHFFDRDTVKFFGSVVYPEVYGGCYFITSEDNFDQTERRFTVRQADERGHIWTVWTFQEFTTKEQAREAIDSFIAQGVRFGTQEVGK